MDVQAAQVQRQLLSPMHRALESIGKCTNTKFFASGIHNCCPVWDTPHRLSRSHLFIHALGGRGALLRGKRRQGEQQRSKQENGSHHFTQSVIHMLINDQD